MKLESVTEQVLGNLRQVVSAELGFSSSTPRPESPRPVTLSVNMHQQMLFPRDSFKQHGSDVMEIINQALSENGFTNDESKNVPYVDVGESYARLSLVHNDAGPKDQHAPKTKWFGLVKAPKDAVLIETNNLPVFDMSYDRFKERALEIARTRDMQRSDKSHD
jgi:hypothetical protein